MDDVDDVPGNVELESDDDMLAGANAIVLSPCRTNVLCTLHPIIGVGCLLLRSKFYDAYDCEMFRLLIDFVIVELILCTHCCVTRPYRSHRADGRT